MVSQCSNYNEIVSNVNTKAANYLGLESVTLYCLLSDKSLLFTYYKNNIVQLNINKLKGIVNTVYTNGQTIIIPELKDDKRFNNQYDIIFNNLSVHSVIYIPLFKLTGKMVGIIIFGHSDPKYFDGNIEIFNNLSNHIAYCLDKCIQLHKNNKELKEKEEIIKRNSEDVNKMKEEINHINNNPKNDKIDTNSCKLLGTLQTHLMLINNINQIMNLISTSLYEILKCESTNLYLFDKESKLLWTITKRNETIKRPYDKGSLKYMVSTGKIEVYDNPKEDVRCDKLYDNCNNCMCAPVYLYYIF